MARAAIVHPFSQAPGFAGDPLDDFFRKLVPFRYQLPKKMKDGALTWGGVFVSVGCLWQME